MKTYALRLRPGQDLKLELIRFAEEKNIQAGCIITCVGSLQKAMLRLAGRSGGSLFQGKHEIISLVGTLSTEGVHFHAAIADTHGTVIGGHLMEGCLIFTTAEIVIGEIEGVKFTREEDQDTSYRELVIEEFKGS